MLKTTASILESFSSIAIMLIFLLMLLIALAVGCFGSMMLIDIAEIMLTPIPY